MATDITGLLTGIPRGGIDPMVSMSPDQQRMAMGARAASGLKSGIRGMLSGGQPTAQQQISIAASQLDLSNPQDLTKVAKLQQISGDSTGAAKTLAQVKEQKELEQRKTQERKVAEALPPEYSALAQAVIDGVPTAITRALEILGRKKPEDKPKAGEKPSGTDIKTMKILLSTAGEDYRGKEGGIFGAFSTNWNDAWNKMNPSDQNQIATIAAEETNKLVDLGFDLSTAQKIVIKKIYTDNLTETGLFEFKGESKLMSPDDIQKTEKNKLEERLEKYS